MALLLFRLVRIECDAGKPDAEDPIERVSSRPDFTVVYPC
jgi:hypothetical protein